MEVLRLIEGLPTDRTERSYAEPGLNLKTWFGGRPLVDVKIVSCGELSAQEVPAAEAVDGDVYPALPIDFTCQGDPEKLMEAARALKDIGNSYVRSKDYGAALAKYRKAQIYLEPLLQEDNLGSIHEDDPSAWLAGGVRPKDRTDVVHVHLALWLNECQVLINLGMWEQAIACAEAVLLEMRGLHSKK
eukprot:4054877-Amphidinium_carterae.1